MKTSIQYFLVICCTFFVQLQQANGQSYARELEIAERYYHEGMYQKALETNTDLLESLSPATGQKLLIKVKLRRLRYLEAMAMYPAFNELRQEVATTAAVYDEQSLFYAYILLEFSQLYIHYSDILTARSYLNQAKSIISTMVESGQDTYFETAILFAECRINIAQGNFSLAEELLPALQAATKKRMDSPETYFELETADFQSRSLNKFIMQQRKQGYAESLTMAGEISRLKGAYTTALEQLAEAENWILDNLSRKDVAYIVNRHEQTLALLQEGKKKDEARKMLEKNIFLAERILGPVHKVYLKMHEDLIDYYISSRYLSKSSKERWEININTSRYFGKDKTPYVLAKRLDAKKDFYAKDFEDAAGQLLEMYQDSTRLPKNHQERVNLLKQYYDVSLAQDQYNEALDYLQEMIAIQENILGADALDYHFSQMALASYYISFTNKFEAADAILKNSFAVIKERIEPGHHHYTDYLAEYAEYYEIVAKYDSAATLLETLRQIKEDKYGTDHIEYAIGLERVVELDLTTGQFNEAEEEIEQIIKIFETDKYRRKVFDAEQAKVFETAARYNALVGLYKEAGSYLSKANRLNRRSPTAIANSTAIDELANLYIRTGDYRRTESLLTEAVAIRKERYGDDSRFLVTPYNQLARLEFINGNYIKADSIASDALQLAQKNYGEGALQLTDSYAIKGEIFTAMGDYEQASENIEAEIAILRKVFGESHVELANAYTQKALNLFFSDVANTEQVLKLLEQSQNIIAENLGADNPVFAVSLKNRSLVLIQLGNLSEAKVLLSRADKIWVDKLGSDRNINSAEIDMLLGDIDMRMGLSTEAAQRYGAAQKTYKKVFNKQHPSYISAVSRLGRVYYAQGNYNRSRKLMDKAIAQHSSYIDKFFPALSEREKARYWLLVKSDFDFYDNLMAADPDNAKLRQNVYNHTIATKALLLSSSIKVRNRILNSGDSLLIENFNAWTQKKETLTKILSYSTEQLREENLDPKKLEKEIEEIEKSLSAQSSIFQENKQEQEYSWTDIRDKLSANEVAVEIIRYRYFGQTVTDSVVYAALIITPETKKAPELVLIPESSDLESKFLPYYRSCIEFDIEDEESYRGFWQPIVEKIPANSTIYLSAEGVYNQINLETIPDNEGRYVLDQSDLVLVSNTRDLVDKKLNASNQDAKQQTMSIFGNPVFYKDLREDEFNTYTNRPITQLPGTMREVQKIEELLRSNNNLNINSYTTLDATEPQVKSMSNPKIFHIATHGFFLEDKEDTETNVELAQEKVVTNPLLRSGLLLRNAGELLKSSNVYEYNREDGVLTAYEAMNLNLDDTDLVVLSACETGRGDNKVGEGVYGLQRSFLVAGAETIIMSLFEVSDEATQKLMVYFYRNWLQKGMGKREAFSEAKKELREEFAEPKYWGAFVMIGYTES